MSDLANQWLADAIQSSTSDANLWFVDENYSGENIDSVLNAAKEKKSTFQIISNRWDLANKIADFGWNARFSDFDCSHIPAHSLDAVFFRISKEKLITHHLINLAANLLKENGLLYLVGYKNEGIKNYVEKASQFFGSAQKATKLGEIYVATIALKELGNAALPSDQYDRAREIFQLDEKSVYSKPGQFGWNKIDQGSTLLIEALKKYIAHDAIKVDRCLDLGCGYGYLTLASADLPIKTFTLTDNNAAALKAAELNCARFKLQAEVFASDAGTQLEAGFDLILCNPPFHQGFSVDTDLTDKFLTNTFKLLKPKAKAFFVVNQFIALENKAAQKGFSRIETLISKSGFKVILLEKNT